MSKKIVITRHKGLLKYLIEEGIVEEGVKVLTEARVEDVRGKHIIGVIPLWLAAYADKITVVKLRVPKNLRGKELTVEDVRWYANQKISTYRIRKVKFNERGGKKKK